MATLVNKRSAPEALASYLNELRFKIGVLREEMVVAGHEPLAAGNESYRLATQLDLLINKYLHTSSSA